MSNVPGVKEVNGQLVAVARDIEPPRGWTTDFETLGGEMLWGNGGEIQQALQNAAVDATGLKPLYATQPSTGDSVVMMEAGSPTAFYIFNRIDESLNKITRPDNLADIVQWIDTKGMTSLEVENIA